jgi:hypothetical protein
MAGPAEHDGAAEAEIARFLGDLSVGRPPTPRGRERGRKRPRRRKATRGP